MAAKVCAYKNCKNNTTNAIPQGTKFFSMFGFPKDEERRNLWLKLAEVPSAIPDQHLFICSDHFDKKYISINQRRNTLVSTAVPFAYNDTRTSANKEGKASTSDSDIEIVENNSIYVANSEEAVEQKEVNLSNPKKRKIVQFSLPKTTSDKPIKNATVCERNAHFQKTDKQKKIIINKTVQKAPATTDSEENNQLQIENDDTQWIDATHATTFIYKGQEYIQMPKKRYIQEKIELMEKVKKYELFLLRLKKELNDLS